MFIRSFNLFFLFSSRSDFESGNPRQQRSEPLIDWNSWFLYVVKFSIDIEIKAIFSQIIRLYLSVAVFEGFYWFYRLYQKLKKHFRSFRKEHHQFFFIICLRKFGILLGLNELMVKFFKIPIKFFQFNELVLHIKIARLFKF